MTEGTYPYHWGGVSTWCHSLTHELSEVEFVLLALARDPLMEPQFELAPNVVELRTIPLWGVLKASDLSRRRGHTSSSVAEFLPLFRSFVGQLVGARPDDVALARTIHGLYRYFLTHDFDAAFRSRATWDAFAAEVEESAVGADVSLADLTTGLHCVYHWCFPLSQRIPRTDVVHMAMVGVSTLVATAAKLEHRVPVLLSEHGIYLRERYLAEHASKESLFLKSLKLGFARRMTELSYGLADIVSPCCDYNRRWELRNGAGPAKLETTYYGVDADTFSPNGDRSAGPPVVTWAGRFHPIKDIETLLRAAALVHRTRPDVQFRLFGSNPAGTEQYLDHCVLLHRQLGLEGTVTFEDFRPHSPAVFGDADLVVLTSISEGFPFTTLEAMLCGKPIVATAVGGVREQIPPSCGVTVGPRDPEAMAGAILDVLHDPERCAERGRAARIWASSMFGIDRFRSSHYALYGRLLHAWQQSTSRNGPRLNGHRPALIGLPSPASARADVIAAHTSLVAELAARVPQPIDPLELTAVIESLGITDELASSRYGARDTFELGERSYTSLIERRSKESTEPEAGDSELDEARAPRKLLSDASRGVFALLPLLVLLVTIRAFAGTGWNGGEILALSLGMTLGVALANGFVQGISRRASLYLGWDQPQLARRLVSLALVTATIGVLALGAAVLLGLTLFGAFSSEQRLIFVVTIVCAVPVWFLAGSLSLARAAGWVVVGLAGGLLAGVAVYRLSGELPTASVLGLLVAFGLMALAVRHVFAGAPIPARLPARSTLALESAVYFAYGVGLTIFVLEPQVMAWLGPRSFDLGRLAGITAIEVGFTLALLPFILSLGVAELTLRRFWLSVKLEQGRTPAAHPQAFGQELVAFHRRYLSLYLAVSGVLSLATWLAVELAIRSGLLSQLIALQSDELTRLVFCAALLSFWFVGWGQFNCMFAINLVRPSRALWPLLAAIAVVTLAGIPLSLFGFGYAMLAFIAGAAVFAGSSFLSCRQVLANADYHYAAAL